MAEKTAELNKNDLEVYSTTEKQIGVWIDGKPLYRKVISFNTSTNGAWTNIEPVSGITIKNLSPRITTAKNELICGYNNGYANNPDTGAGLIYISVIWRVQNNYLQYYAKAQSNNYPFHIDCVMEYTK